MCNSIHVIRGFGGHSIDIEYGLICVYSVFKGGDQLRFEKRKITNIKGTTTNSRFYFRKDNCSLFREGKLGSYVCNVFAGH